MELALLLQQKKIKATNNSIKIKIQNVLDMYKPKNYYLNDYKW